MTSPLYCARCHNHTAASKFVDGTARRVLATGARVVGCTSTFEQHVASLALLRRIRELDPGVVTMLGGANCETVMGGGHAPLFRLGGLCRLRRGRWPDRGPAPPGRRARPGGGAVGIAPRRARPPPSQKRRGPLPRALFHDLDSLPTPRFDDYFATLAASPLRSSIRPGLPLETSRGCWWGAVHQCTFCGLNGTSLGYRVKSPGRVLTELDELQDRYHLSDFEAVDNILDMGYYTSLLAADGRHRRIFYEIKTRLAAACSSWSLVSSRRLTNTALRHLRSTG